MKNDEYDILFNTSLIRGLLKKEPFYYVDIIHESSNLFKEPQLGKSCSEYLAESNTNDQNIIIPIPIQHCFPSSKKTEDKITNIYEYINYFNDSGLFNYEIINDKEEYNNIYDNYFKSTYDVESSNFINTIIKKNIDISSETKLSHDVQLKEKTFLKLKESLVKEVNEKYSDRKSVV